VDVYEASGAINVFDLKMCSFLKPETTGVDSAKADSVSEESYIFKDVSDFVSTEDGGEFLLPFGPHKAQGGPFSLYGVLIKELDPTNSDGAGTSGPLLDILGVEEIVPELLFGDQVRGLVVMFRQLAHGANIHLLGALTITF
jgi:hypothetical protein